MTAQIIEFKTKAIYPGNEDPQPRFVLEIFDKPDGSGFDWHVLADEPIGEDELSDYLGDMFFTLNPDVVPEPGIFSRLKSFLSNLISKGDPE